MTSSVVRLPLLTTPARKPSSLVDQLLREQQDLTAVERFARRAHEPGARPAQEAQYRELLPLSSPKDGQQYAFQVDLDICTGCKACVTACHNLNGLDDDETWRSVGLLHGGTPTEPVKQTVTTACHHCLEPACMSGCPVGAYEKSATTGIVKHLDDQCIGCQYCTFTCPYEVPQFNAKRGIVRKCDMCSDRLAVGEAPACVQACPNEAIAITIVEKRQVIEDAQGNDFLPGAPSPGITMPSTVYKTERALPRNLLPANFYRVAPAERHWPLVCMLVLTQLSVGAFAVDAVASRTLPAEALAMRPLHSALALAIGLAALGASVLHLGRPLYAFRAVLGLRTSWMSREILAFGLFAGLAMAYAAASWQEALTHALGLPALPPQLALRVQSSLSVLVAVAGGTGVLCSTLIYHVTRRPFWHGSLTGFRFFMTALVLGLGTTVLTLAATARRSGASALFVDTLTLLFVLAAATKLAGEGTLFFQLGQTQLTPLRRAAILMKRDLATYTFWRFTAGALGGVVLPLVARTYLGEAAFLAWMTAALLVVLVGELLERTLFFAASTASGMPGGLR
jgi:formate dehydrogenase iron-sulfur subunit